SPLMPVKPSWRGLSAPPASCSSLLPCRLACRTCVRSPSWPPVLQPESVCSCLNYTANPVRRKSTLRELAAPAILTPKGGFQEVRPKKGAWGAAEVPACHEEPSNRLSV